MKASVYTCEKTFVTAQADPVEPAADEVRVGVAYCGLCGTDLHVYHGHMDARVGCERIIGHEMSGVVEAVGTDVGDVKVGDHVTVRPLDPCGECPACKAGHAHICHKLKFLGLDTHGALQDSWTVPSHTIHKLPAGMSLKHAALVEPLAVACHDVTRSRLVAGEDVLVIGGGPIGMLVAMVAKQKGANVTISEVNDSRLAMAEKLDFDTVNPAESNLAEAINAKTGDKGADVIFEVSGSPAAVSSMTEVAAVRARIVMVAIHAESPKVDLFKFFWREIEMLGARVYAAEDFEMAIELISSGQIACDEIITSVQSLEQVGEALADLAGNPSAMKSLIQVNPEVA